MQDELAKAQTFNQRSSSEDSASLSDIDVQSELDAQRRELEVEAHRKLTAMREEMEKELKTQMKRQIAAHSDHIKDVLEVQGKELNRIHERALDESLSNQTASHKQELAKIKGNKLVLSKTKLEVAVVRPGSLADDGNDHSIRFDEDRLKLIRVLVTEKMKGILIL